MHSKVALVFLAILAVAFAAPGPNPDPQLGFLGGATSGGLLGNVLNTATNLAGTVVSTAGDVVNALIGNTALSNVSQIVGKLDPGSDIAMDVMCTAAKAGASVFPFDAASLIGSACDMAKSWMSGMKGIGLQPPQYKMILTANQRAYWDAVTTLRDPKNFLNTKSTISSIKSAFNTSLNPASLVKRQAGYPPVVRKDMRCMTDEERIAFFNALIALKTDIIDGFSKWDILTAYHYFVPFTPAAHFSAGLLPFHREAIKNLEIALRMVNPNIAFPFWDTSLDAEMPNPLDSILWTDSFMGASNCGRKRGTNGSCAVTGGAFGVFTGATNAAFPTVLHQGGITRAMGMVQSAILFNKEYIDIILSKPTINNWVFCYDPFMDTIHAGIHMYIGGLLGNPLTAPNDPLFYFLHTFIDSLWERWRQAKQTPLERSTIFALPCPYNPFDLPTMQLFPFSIKVQDAYSNIYTDPVNGFYTYQAPPTCANNCNGSKYLACKPNGRCMSKIKPGGDCSSTTGVANPCYGGTCQAGTCVAS